MKLRTISLLTLCVTGLAGAPPNALAQPAEAYALGPGDRLRITVSEWPPAGGDFRTRLDGVFAIDASGHLSLPLVGSVPAQGQATPELALTIGEVFQAKVGALTAPAASVEIVEHRPFYVVGAIEKPGSYPFRPGMTALHVLSIAGGLFRRPEADVMRLEREAVTAAGSKALQDLARDAALLRQARLEAELVGRAPIAWPADLAAQRAEPRVARLMADETAVLEQRLAGLKAAVDGQLRLKTLGDRQSVSLAAQAAAVERQMAIAKRELDEQVELVNKGLSRRPLLFPIEARLADAEGKRRQLESDSLRNAQEVARAEQAAEELRSNRRAEVIAQLKETREAIGQAQQKIATDIRLGEQSGLEVLRHSGEAPTMYSILRQEGGTLRERPVTETTRVEPGDIVRIVVPTKAGAAVQTSIGGAAPVQAAAARPVLAGGRP